MVQFTVEEENLICMYHKTDRRRTAANIRAALPDMDEDMAALPGFTLAEQRVLRGTITLRTNADIEALFCMTPYYYKTGARDQAKLHALDTLTTETEFALLIYRKA